jgi:hypothetical protein
VLDPSSNIEEGVIRLVVAAVLKRKVDVSVVGSTVRGKSGDGDPT